MKKFLFSTLVLLALIFSNGQIAHNQSTKVCTFPNGQRALTTENKTTIEFQHCEAIKTSDSNQCKTLIEDSSEFINANNKQKAEIETKASQAITLCQTQIKDIAEASKKEKETKAELTKKINTNSSCITNDQKLNTTSETQGQNDTRVQVQCSLGSNPSEGLQTLQSVFSNQFVYQLIEPITSDNLIIERRTCTYEYLRNKDGLIQAAGTRNNNSDIERDENFYNNNVFTITESSCFITYVDECQPELVLDARITINKALPVSTYCKTYQVISGSSGTDFIKGFVNIIYRLAVGIIGVLAVIVMVINGIRISTAGDDSGAVSDAKERIAQSIFGLAVLFLAWIILRSVNPNFFTTNNLEINDPRNTQNQTTPANNTTQNDN